MAKLFRKFIQASTEISSLRSNVAPTAFSALDGQKPSLLSPVSPGLLGIKPRERPLNLLESKPGDLDPESMDLKLSHPLFPDLDSGMDLKFAHPLFPDLDSGMDLKFAHQLFPDLVSGMDMKFAHPLFPDLVSGMDLDFPRPIFQDLISSMRRTTDSGVLIPSLSDIRSFSSGGAWDIQYLLDLQIPSTFFWNLYYGPNSHKRYWRQFYPSDPKVHHLRQPFLTDPDLRNWKGASDDAISILLKDLTKVGKLESMEKFWPQLAGYTGFITMDNLDFWVYCLTKHRPNLPIPCDDITYFKHALEMFNKIQTQVLDKLDVENGTLGPGNPFLEGIPHPRGFLFTIAQFNLAFPYHGVATVCKPKSGELAGQALLLHIGLRHDSCRNLVRGFLKFEGAGFTIDNRDTGFKILWPTHVDLW